MRGGNILELQQAAAPHPSPLPVEGQPTGRGNRPSIPQGVPMSTALQFDPVRLPKECEDLRTEVRAFLKLT